MTPLNNIEEFLLKNGFEKISDVKFTNDKCDIVINLKPYHFYQVYFNDIKGSIFSNDLNIYWLIGVLTYYDMIEKNYKK